ncbi:MAG: hypF [Firmicutes bacterium]|nr:hypF [Bacillota bacterium]
METAAWEIKLFGLVQGVGFRPFIHRLAQRYNLKGEAFNASSCLTVCVEGSTTALAGFTRSLFAEPPGQAIIDSYEITVKEGIGYKDFSIVAGKLESGNQTMVASDTGVCADCLSELRDINNRRHGYLMIGCSECGPRFSIMNTLPYDRENTSMARFIMCPDCRKEYEDINNRRYHTEIIACPACGPQVWLIKRDGSVYSGRGHDVLKQGKILAVKGLGGFHLACDALNKAAIVRLRIRKRRNDKPFAVMCRDIETVAEYCFLGEKEVELLQGKVRPIVLLELRPEVRLPLNLAPGLKSLGVMLPYTPVHQALFAGDLKIIVLTSANFSDEPLITDNQEALNKLNDVADYFLFHDRPVVNGCDDSVTSIIGSEILLHRRARGFVPLPVRIENDCQSVIACGGDIKSAFCLLQGRDAFLSQYLGDLAYLENYQRYLDTIARFKQFTKIEPQVIAHDLHPGYISTHYAKSVSNGYIIGVQHHHAHFASCMAENKVSGPALGVICDGAGYGTDGSIWGFEFLYGDFAEFERLAQLEYMPLAGGDDAVQNPVSIAFSYLHTLFNDGGTTAARLLRPYSTDSDIETIGLQLDNKIGIWQTSSCGRLFDAVAGMLGICTKVSYEGQAAMLLEAASKLSGAGKYRYGFIDCNYPYRITVQSMFEDMLLDITRGLPKEVVGGKFHATLIDMIISTVVRLSGEKKCKQVVLSGGVFQNRLLFENVVEGIKGRGLNVYSHKKVPANDGGLALGQAVIADEVYKHVSGCNR